MRDLDIRRPDLRDTPRQGTVRWFKPEKGYGRITADDGEILFVLFTGMVGDGLRTLDEGDRVSFVWRGGLGDHGRHLAEDVRREPSRPVDRPGDDAEPIRALHAKAHDLTVTVRPPPPPASS
jgi:cold shock CspA family protein